VASSKVAEVVVKRLVELGQLPVGFAMGSTAVHWDRVLLGPMPDIVVGRQEEVQALIAGLQGPGAAVLVAGPGEGKSTVAMAAAQDLCERGWCPGGAYVLDFASE
jgi:hypothetical protein